MKLCTDIIKKYMEADPPKTAVVAKYLYYNDKHKKKIKYDLF